MLNSDFEIAVVGGGIAGLAIAEIFQRSGHKVVLFERSDGLCGEASGGHHGWFHFGSLYSIFPQKQFLRTMVGGIEDLLDYYSGFEGMNIKPGESGRLVFPQNGKSWIRDEPLEYLIAARNDPDFSLFKFDGIANHARKLFFLATWEWAIKLFISRHNRFANHDWTKEIAASQWISSAWLSDYSRDVIEKPFLDDISLDPDRHFSITGYDRPMRSRNIATALAASFLVNGGRVELNTDISNTEKQGNAYTLHAADGRKFTARKIILAAGKWSGKLLTNRTGVKVVASPMLVVWPKVTDRQFVRMTPFPDKSVNHLHHGEGELAYSLIGGGHSASADDEEGCNKIRQELTSTANSVFPKLADAEFAETYIGYKTEIVSKGAERNYQYITRQLDDGLYAVIPGKFSLAFSLAVNTYHQITGKQASRDGVGDTKLDEEAASMIAPTLHGKMIETFLQSRSSDSVMGNGNNDH